MDRIATLILASQNLARRLYASLPWGLRVADLFLRLAADSTEAFGRMIFAEFLLRGVTEMPDPGPRWNPKSSKPADTLPRGYGQDFASRVYKTLIGKFRDPELAENAMVEFMIRFTLQGGSKGLRDKCPLKEAQGYVMTGVVRQGINVVNDKTKQRHREKSITQEDADGEETNLDISDPHAFEDIAELIPEHQLKSLLRELSQKVHPDAGLYVKYLTEGYNEKEIVGDPAHGLQGKLPNYSSSPQNWNQKVKPKILDFFKRQLDAV
jgi:hypothetical protein